MHHLRIHNGGIADLAILQTEGHGNDRKEIMPLRKSAPKRKHSEERLKRYHARKAAEQYFGRKAIRNMDIDHKNGNNTDNRRSNLRIVPKEIHGQRHGRGNPGSRLRDIKLKVIRTIKMKV